MPYVDIIKPIYVEGLTMLQHGDDHSMTHPQSIVVDHESVTVRLMGCGPGCFEAEPIVSTDPAVILFMAAIEELRLQTAYINRSLADDQRISE